VQKIIECVPNVSEGRDPAVYRAIAAEAETVEGVHLLDVDPGKATNRTVITFAGEPEAVIEAAVRVARKAKDLIDMRKHSGEHPRFGALDVCPLVPVNGVTMEECAEYARRLGRRLGEEIGLTVFLYERAASRPERCNLAEVRAGEYEGLAPRLQMPAWRPDFGPAEFQPRSGATAVGARDFLIAYNVNLNTTSTRRANAIAYDVREKGRRDPQDSSQWIPGTLKAVKGIGWYIEEYGVCQVSLNLTDVTVTPMHAAFDEVERCAAARGVRVTGSELVGLVPLRALLDAGRHFLRKQQRSLGVPDRELIKIAVRSLGLDELSPFDPQKKVIEYVLAARAPRKRLADLTLRGFAEETARESPAPGGGSVAAAAGALGAALGTMVANLSAHKAGWDARWEEFSRHAERGQMLMEQFLALVDADSDAFDAVLAAWRLPEGDAAAQAAKRDAVQVAVRGAIETPLAVMEAALEALELCAAMAEHGLPASASDAGVGAMCSRLAVRAAGLNVRINLKDLADGAARAAFQERTRALERRAEAAETAVLQRIALD
jgi:glutamate formiminotransferase/formiminotetrahydrofolate cyclodeaminase